MSKVRLITERLIEHLVPEIDRAKSIYILTSFAMKSGVKVIRESFECRAAERGADIKICTGDYLFITQPEALKSLIIFIRIVTRVTRGRFLRIQKHEPSPASEENTIRRFRSSLDNNTMRCSAYRCSQ